MKRKKNVDEEPEGCNRVRQACTNCWQAIMQACIAFRVRNQYAQSHLCQKVCLSLLLAFSLLLCSKILLCQFVVQPRLPWPNSVNFSSGADLGEYISTVTKQLEGLSIILSNEGSTVRIGQTFSKAANSCHLNSGLYAFVCFYLDRLLLNNQIASVLFYQLREGDQTIFTFGDQPSCPFQTSGWSVHPCQERIYIARQEQLATGLSLQQGFELNRSRVKDLFYSSTNITFFYHRNRTQQKYLVIFLDVVQQFSTLSQLDKDKWSYYHQGQVAGLFDLVLAQQSHYLRPIQFLFPAIIIFFLLSIIVSCSLGLWAGTFTHLFVNPLKVQNRALNSFVCSCFDASINPDPIQYQRQDSEMSQVAESFQAMMRKRCQVHVPDRNKSVMRRDQNPQILSELYSLVKGITRPEMMVSAQSASP